MSSATRVAAPLVTTLVLLLALLGAGSAGPAAPAAEARRAPDDAITKTVGLQWQGTTPRRRLDLTASTRVPGIGQLKLVCKPNNTMVKIVPDDRNRETTMWLAKYEKKGGRDVVAVKNVRVYRFDTALDDGTGGTGRAAHEGLNQETPIETFSSGYAEGVISTRSGRHLPGGAMAAVPATAIKLSWWWENFREPLAYRTCRMDATLTTDPTQSALLTWHGDQDARSDQGDRTVATADLAPLGTLELQCEPGPRGTRWISLVTDDPGATLFARTISGEGEVRDHVEEDSLDAGGGHVGPLDLPENGMMELSYTAHGRTVSLFLSSYWITNDESSPALNLCEVAAAPF
jgi:hypothetical protein